MSLYEIFINGDSQRSCLVQAESFQGAVSVVEKIHNVVQFDDNKDRKYIDTEEVRIVRVTDFILQSPKEAG